MIFITTKQGEIMSGINKSIQQNLSDFWVSLLIHRAIAYNLSFSIQPKYHALSQTLIYDFH